MARYVLCVLALLVAGGHGLIGKKVLQKPAEHTCLEHQHQLMSLFFHIHEPTLTTEHHEIENTWDILKNSNLYDNSTAVEISVKLLTKKWIIPKGVPFSEFEYTHVYQAEAFFNLLYSAKTYDTFYKTAVYLRPHLNEYLYVYAVTVAIHHRHDTQDIVVPPLYDIFPSFFHNAEIMTTAHRINTQGKHFVDYYPSTYVWEDNVVIRANETVWPYHSKEMAVAYFTHDPTLNNLYYYLNTIYPLWLGQNTYSLVKDRRGELVWWWHRQLLSRYYMERLSNGLGEIPDLDWHVVEEGYTCGLTYWNGIPYPSRPDYFHLDSPWIVEKLQKIEEYESRIFEAIDKGFIITDSGEHLGIRNPEAIDVLGRIIEADVDSPNVHYYKNIVNIWKKILGNSRVPEVTVVDKHANPIPVHMLPSVLELPQTTTRDPAFYMIWKRVLQLFHYWHEQLPKYTHEELAVPSVTIDNVDVDKLVTYFEYTRMNITNALYLDQHEREHGHEKHVVLVERSQLNHKVFTVRVNVKSEETKHVTVRFFLAPKYDSRGQEIPIHHNSHHFFQFDEFEYELMKGENTITRISTDVHTPWASDELYDGHELYEKVEAALHGHGEYVLDIMRKPDAPPRHLLLPKGRVGGMPFVLMVYISEFHAPNVVFGSGFDPVTSFGWGTGARRLTSDPLGFPVDRPLHEWQIAGLKNIWFEDVFIHHKNTPEVPVHHGH